MAFVIALALLALAAPAVARADTSFSSSHYAITDTGGGFASDVAIADFDKDGHLDVVVAFEGSDPGQVSIALGDGTGGLGAGTVVAAGGRSTERLAVGDFDKDGNLDLAVASMGGDHVMSILLGHGDGTFAAPATYPAPIDSRGIAVGDFDEDGYLDVATANANGGTGNVSVFLNQKDGTFGARTDYATRASTPAFSVATGDFNGDGHLDLVSADPANGTSYVTLLQGSGTGSFTKVADFSSGDNRSGQSQTITVGDFNHDGRSDAATTNFEGDVNGDSASVLLNTGLGGSSTFDTAGVYSLGVGPWGIAPGDFDLDGNIDLAVGVDDDRYAGVLPGDGSGGFGALQGYTSLDYLRNIAVGDMNEDGKPDIVVASGGAYVLLNTTVVAPAAATDPASGVGQTSATLNGTVNPRGRDTHYWFEYGTTTAYGGQAPAAAADAGSGSANVPVSAPLSGLSESTTYHYRTVATAGTDTVHGADQTFTTGSPSLPVAATDPATDVGQSSATLNGTVDPNGRDTHYFFEYGTSTAYGARVPLSSADAGSGTTNVSVSSQLGGLEAATRYHYRIVATAGDDTVRGADQAFTTSTRPASPAAQTPAASLPAAASPAPAVTHKKRHRNRRHHRRHRHRAQPHFTG